MGQAKPLTKAEKEWIGQFQKVCSKCPKSLWLYIANDTFHIMKLPEDGDILKRNSDSIDDQNSMATISGMKGSGGDW